MSNDLAYPRDFKIAFVPYPYFDGHSIPGHHIEDAMSITAHCQHPDAAWEFIQWWALEGMMELALAAGYRPMPMPERKHASSSSLAPKALIIWSR